MKKKFIAILTLMLISLSASAHSNNINITDIIKLYKAGNYSECYIKLEEFIKKDSTNALAFYYMGMTSAQLGKKDDAISYYDKVLAIENHNNNLYRFAQKGKRCLETPDKCEESDFGSLEDEFIQSKKGLKYTEKVKSELERLKIENLMREMNREDSIDVNQFKDYKDFSSVPTNDEIIAALKTLQQAGFGNVLNNNYSDFSSLIGNSQLQNPMLNMLGSNSMNPQLIQALFTNNNIIQGL
ncbi:tetratricopeptide repeat protein [bacterium]|nr:tetratricopeptide repeat protein [bacterium]